MYNMLFARREVWQEGKGEALIYKHTATQIRLRNALLLQKNKKCSLLNVNGMMLPGSINHKCNDAQKECINCNLDLPIFARGGWQQHH